MELYAARKDEDNKLRLDSSTALFDVLFGITFSSESLALHFVDAPIVSF